MLQREQGLLLKIKNYFNCGSLNFNNNRKTCIYSVTNVTDVVYNILPHFAKYTLRGTKYLDFLDFLKLFIFC